MEPQNQFPTPQNGQVPSKPGLKKTWPYIVGAFVVVAAGVLTAWLISSRSTGGSATNSDILGNKVTANEAGVLDPNIKYDNATGTLEEGGINGEGTYHLVREGGISKNVYLTSSMVDLSKFVGKKVEVWGDTLASKKVGWLMDVAKIQVTP